MCASTVCLWNRESTWRTTGSDVLCCPWRGRGAGSREQVEQGGGFGVPAAANLKPKHDQAAPPAAVKLGVSLPALPPGSCAHSSAWLGLCVGVRPAVPRKGADKRSIDGELGTVPEREAVAYDLAAPGVVDGHIKVHGRRSNVATNAGSGFLAKPCDGALDGNGSGSAPDVAQAARWSPYSSSVPRQEQARGPSGRGS